MTQDTSRLARLSGISISDGDSVACADASSPERKQLALFTPWEAPAYRPFSSLSPIDRRRNGLRRISEPTWRAYARTLQRAAILSAISGSSNSPSEADRTTTSSGGCHADIGYQWLTRLGTGGSAGRKRR